MNELPVIVTLILGFLGVIVSIFNQNKRFDDMKERFNHLRDAVKELRDSMNYRFDEVCARLDRMEDKLDSQNGISRGWKSR